MTIAIAAVLGIAIGVILGSLGGGGSILAVPALVYVIGQGPQEATTASLVIIGITSAISTVSYACDRHVRWGAGFAFGVAGVGASYLGTALNHTVPATVLLVSFSVIMLASAIGMLTKSANRSRTSGKVGARDPALAKVAAGSTDPDVREVGAQQQEKTTTNRGALNTAIQVVIAGLAVGFLTGFLGVGGGFIVVPALVMILGYRMPVAVGTSLLIIAFNSAVSLVTRIGHNDFDWAIIIPFAVAAIVGSLFGKRIASRLPAEVLGRCFAILLVCVGLFMGIEALSGTS